MTPNNKLERSVDQRWPHRARNGLRARRCATASSVRPVTEALGSMDEPPILLDGARVIEYAVFDPSVKPTGHVSLIVGGVTLDLAGVRGVAIAEDLVESGMLLLHCDGQWQTLGAGYYDSAESARESARHAYSGISAQWKQLHDLSAGELAEVEAVRSHLRELAAEYPNEP